MPDLILLPSGHPAFVEDAAPDSPGLPEALAAPLARAFGKSPSEGLLCLATLSAEAVLPPHFAFWRRFGESYLSALCHTPEATGEPAAALPPPVEDLAAIAGSAPPMRGGEYLGAETLTGLWTELDAHVRAEVARCPGGLSAWLHGRSPLWHRVGRVCFHILDAAGPSDVFGIDLAQGGAGQVSEAAPARRAGSKPQAKRKVRTAKGRRPKTRSSGRAAGAPGPGLPGFRTLRLLARPGGQDDRRSARRALAGRIGSAGSGLTGENSRCPPTLRSSATAPSTSRTKSTGTATTGPSWPTRRSRSRPS